MKKFFVTVLSVIMLFGMTACGGMGHGTQGTKPDNYTDDGRLIIQMFGIDLDSLQSQTEDTKKIMAVIEDKFNVKFTFLSGTTSSWENLLGQYIGGGDVPDVFFHTKQEPAYSTWLKDGYLFNYSDYLDDYPNLKKAFERYDEASIKLSLGGDYYSYPIVMDSTTDKEVINEHALFYRRDWYEALKAKNWTPSSGRALVDPEDENFNYLNFYDLCEGFTLGDPDGNGKNDTYGYALNKDVYWMYPLFSLFGVNYNGWYKDGDKWKPEAISDKTKEAVMFVADMFDKGFINSDYASTSQQAMKNDFCNALAGMMTYNATYPMGKGVLDLMEKYVPEGKKMSDVVRAMPVVTGKDGSKYMVGYSNFYGYNAINNDLSENKKRTILSIMDWMLTEEGMTLLNYGIEVFGLNLVTGSEWGEIKKAVKAGTGYDIPLMGDGVGSGDYSNVMSMFQWTLYNASLAECDAKEALEYCQNINVEWAEADLGNRMGVGLVYPGFDDTPVMSWDPAKGVIRKISNTGAEFYASSWKAVLELEDRIDWVIISTFNDWTEGTIIEPTLQFGHTLAEMTRDNLALFKGVTNDVSLQAITENYLNTRKHNYNDLNYHYSQEV